MIPSEFLGIFAAFGLSAAAGFNAWATMLIVSLAARMGWLELAAPYDVMGHEGVLIFLIVMTVIEGTADKIPAMDHASHLVHTVIQPAAGALLFASQGGVITEVSPVLAFIIGALVAGTIHGVRASVRPLVTASTVGTGNAIVSLVEDVAAVLLSLGAIFAPVVAAAVVVVGVVALAHALMRRRRLRRQPV